LAYYNNRDQHSGITNEDVIEYPTAKGIPIDQIDTHSLRSKGASALSLAGYSGIQIQKMGWWRGITFKEYIREELACFLEGMSTSMKKQFNFVNIAGNAFNTTTMEQEYEINVSAAAAV
jgi:hypothetical protein